MLPLALGQGGAGRAAQQLRIDLAVPRSPVRLESNRTVQGKLVQLDGKTPVAGIDVQVVNAGGKVVASTVTDSQGAFALAPLAPGQYSLLVGARTVSLVAGPGGAAELLLVASPAVLTAAQGLTTWSWVGLGTGGALVLGGGTVGIVALSGGFESERKKRRTKISPSSP